MKKTKLKMIALALFAFATVNVSNAQVTGTTSCSPPASGVYRAPALFAHYSAPGLDCVVSLASIDQFSACDAPPAAVGSSTTHSYSAHFKCTMVLNGATQIRESPTLVTLHMTDAGPDGTGAEVYQTEMLQLDIQGGTLPPGVMIRESPTLQSTGQTTVRPVTGGYRIDSFFDVFTELSVDGGASWMPSTSGPGHVTLGPATAGIPTMGEWGLIIFGSLIVGLTAIMLRRKVSVA